jgi:hypothetical protein
MRSIVIVAHIFFRKYLEFSVLSVKSFFFFNTPDICVEASVLSFLLWQKLCRPAILLDCQESHLPTELVNPTSSIVGRATYRLTLYYHNLNQHDNVSNARKEVRKAVDLMYHACAGEAEGIRTPFPRLHIKSSTTLLTEV